MAKTTPQPQQFPSAAKWISIVLFCLWSIVSASAQDVSSLAGTWVIRFSNGVDRVYRIAADGTYSSTDADGTIQGNLAVEKGQFLTTMSDGRVQRFSKLSDTLLKVEAFGSRDSFDKGKSRAVGTGTLERPIPAATPTPAVAMVPAPAAPPIPAATPKSQIAEKRKVEPGEVSPTAESTRKLVLSTSWNTPMQGGSNTMEDLAKLFGGLAKPNVDLTENSRLAVYEGVRYLTPINEAVAALKLGSRLPSKNPVVCPGFPRDSFFTYAFDGQFDGDFNRIHLIVDRADQFVGVELVAEAPKTVSKSVGREQGFRTYNFVLTRTKAMNTLIVRHRIALPEDGGWKYSKNPGDIIPTLDAKNEQWKLARVDSLLAQPDPKFPTNTSNLALKEISRWYVPKPVVELILTCVQKSGR